MKAISRSTKQSHLDTIHYEIAMLNFCGKQLDTHRAGEQETYFKYAFLECFLLHYRNLIDFFSGKHHRQAKGLNGTADLSTMNAMPWAGRDLTESEKGRLQAPAAKLDEEYCKEISQYLQHCTERRFSEGREWCCRDMYRELEPTISEFLRLFPQQRAEKRCVAVRDGSRTDTVGIPVSPFADESGFRKVPKLRTITAKG